MPECAACGNHLTTDYLRVFGDDEGTIDSCPHCPPGGARGPRRRKVAETASRDPGNGQAGSNSGAPGAEAKPEVPAGSYGAESSDGDSPSGDADPVDADVAVKTAGRSLEWPRESRVGRTRTTRESGRSRTNGETDRPGSAHGRFNAALSTVLDAIR